MTFEHLDPDRSKVNFVNAIVESDTLNYFEFPYLYLGGGVSVGDINNDGLIDIYFTGNLVSNRLYLNKGAHRFEDITELAGVSGDSRWYTGSTMVDINSDGYLDIYTGVSQVFGDGANQLFVNNGDNTFSEVAESYGIADPSTTIQSTFFDYDNDGLLDLFVANYPIVRISMGNQYYKDKMDLNLFEDSGHLYKNNGDNTFSDVTVSAGVNRFGLSLGVIATDFNDDGYKDLYVSNDFNVPDYYYQNNGDGTFSEISQKVVRHTAMFGMGIDAGDFNNDGLSDLIQVDMTAEDHIRSKTNMASMSPETFYEAVAFGFNYQYMQNTLQLNNGITEKGFPVFSDVARFAGMATTDWSWGAAFADFNNDGWKDVFVSNGVKRDVNNNDVNAQYEMTGMFGQQERPDYRLMPSTPIANYAFRNNGDFTFTKVTQDWNLDKEGFSNGFAYADLDNDGDLDLVINNIDEPASIYINKTENNGNHFLQIKFKGDKNNPLGIGTKVEVKTGDLRQTQELTLTRGYQSSVAPVLHFGIGETKLVDSIKVTWPNGRVKKLNTVAVDQLLEITYDQGDKSETKSGSTAFRFTDITDTVDIFFTHEEDAYDDFAFEPLLPHRYSKLGPGLTVGDVNNDGLDDFFVGNATGNIAAMYVQQSSGSFEVLSGPWEEDSVYEDTGTLLFDADNDGDNDLYVVNGGNHKLKPAAFYQDRLYINTTSGFVRASNTLPYLPSSGMEVVAGDYDQDGDLDLFVGGRIVPGKYPFPSQSYILRNDGGKDLALRYTDVTEDLLPELNEIGLVTAALWDDFDGDNQLDIVITGEWMPIRFFKNVGNGFEEVTKQLGLEDQTGWWYALEKIDLDADGDTDYLAGNLGLNYKYQASSEAPFEVYANDFDENGTSDIVLSYHKKGTKLPLRGRECSAQQIPAIKQRFNTFASFAEADLSEIYGEGMLKDALQYTANTFAHHWLENMGNGTYELHRLPNSTQFSSINKFLTFDYNRDKYPDVLAAGNLLGSEVETPRNDAGTGLVLTGNDTGALQVVAPNISNVFIDGEVRAMAKIRLGSKGHVGLLVAVNNNRLKLIQLNTK